jgi:hypothetical protein
VKVEHVEDATKSGIPKCSQVIVDLILKTVTKNNTIRQWLSQVIVNKVSNTPGIARVSTSTV